MTLDFGIGKNTTEGKTHMMCTEGTEGQNLFCCKLNSNVKNSSPKKFTFADNLLTLRPFGKLLHYMNCSPLDYLQ